LNGKDHITTTKLRRKYWNCALNYLESLFKMSKMKYSASSNIRMVCASIIPFAVRKRNATPASDEKPFKKFVEHEFWLEA